MNSVRPQSQAHGRRPLDPIAMLTSVFERVLDRAPIGPDEDFFDIGGSSILAISVLMAIEDESGVALPIAALYEAPTIASLAGRLGAEPRLPSSLVPLRANGSGRNFFLVHGLGGTVLELRALAHEIQADVSIFGIEAIGLDRSPPLHRVEDMADAYVGKMLGVQPSGPFLLAGYSFGGLVAFEMARRLLSLGHEVPFVGLLDSYLDDGFTWRSLRASLRQVARAPTAARGAEVLKILDKLRFRLGLWRAQSCGSAGNTLEDTVAAVRAASNAARQRYRPRVAPVDIVFFRADTVLDVFPTDPAAVWGRLVRRLTVEKVAGDHYTLLDPNRGALPAALGRHLRALCP